MTFISAKKIQVKHWENLSLGGGGRWLLGINSVARLQSHRLSAKVGLLLGRAGRQQAARPLFPVLPPRGQGSSPGTHRPPRSPKTAPSTAPTPWMESSRPVL